MRRRFTIDEDRWHKALEYAKATNRTPSELICEALDQMQARYPKRRQEPKYSNMALAADVAKILRLRVPAGTLEGK